MRIETIPTIEMLPIGTLKPYAGNARTHSKKQIKQTAGSISRFGFTNPVLISDALEIIAGHGRVLAARDLGMDRVPVLRLSHLNAAERRAYPFIQVEPSSERSHHSRASPFAKLVLPS